jgi:Flp pilus assembly protein TadD
MSSALATSAFTQGKYDEALKHTQEALARTPADLALLNIAGICAARLGHPDAAARFWQQALAVNPNDTQSLGNLGVLAAAAKRLDEARAYFARVLQIDAGNADAMVKMAHILADMGRNDEAAHFFRAAIQLAPNDAALLVRYGGFLARIHATAAAESVYRQATEIAPANVEAHFFLGNLLSEQDRLAESEVAYRATIAADPAYAPAHANLGVVLRMLHNYTDSEASYFRALKLEPDNPQWISNLGVLYVQMRRFDEAETCYRRALEVKPGNIDIIFNLSYVLLLKGDYAEGFRCYEARYDSRNSKPVCGTPRLPYPQWKGEDITGKSFVVWHEQGWGDVIEFSRFAMDLKKRGAARVTLVCDAPVRALLETLPDIDAVASPAEAAAIPPHDYWTLLFSIPIYTGLTPLTIPFYASYLSVPPDRLAAWKPKLSGRGIGLKIGLVWKANAKHKSSLERSLPSLETLRKLWNVPGITFYSLQKNDGEEEGRSPPKGQPLIHLGSDVKDFADTAAIVSQLDLVISVDTAIVHVAGALGKPVWVFLPWVADWRWMKEGDQTAWYPSVRLFRQSQPYEWDDVVTRIAAALKQFKKTGKA